MKMQSNCKLEPCWHIPLTVFKMEKFSILYMNREIREIIDSYTSEKTKNIFKEHFEEKYTALVF